MSDSKKINALSALKLILLLIPVCFGIFFVTKYGVNVMYWDDWEYMLNMDKLSSFSYLWKQHNEHRIFFPKILSCAVGILTSWNSKALMYVSQIFLMIFYFAAIKIFADGRKLSELSFKETGFCVLLGLYIYNIRQYENLLWGFQTAWFMITSFGVLSFYLFDKYLKTEKMRYLLLSQCCAVIATYCLLHGLAIWAAYLCVMIISLISKERLPKAAYIIITLTGALATVLYFINWHTVGIHRRFAASGLVDFIIFLPKLVFSSIISVSNYTLANIFFIAIAAVILICAISDIAASKFIANIRIYGPEIMAAGIIAAISIGRSGLGLESRYTTDGTFFIAFFLLISIHAINLSKERDIGGETKKKLDVLYKYTAKTAAVLIVSIFFLSTLSVITDRRKVMNWTGLFSDSKFTLMNYRYKCIEDLSVLYPYMGTSDLRYSEEAFRDLFGKMDENGWNAFADSEDACTAVPLPDTSGAQLIENSPLNEMTLFYNYKAVEIKADAVFRNRAKYTVIINGNAYKAAVINGRIRFIQSVDILSEGENTAVLYVTSGNKKYISPEYRFEYSSAIKDIFASGTDSATHYVSHYHTENDKYIMDYGVGIAMNGNSSSANTFCDVHDKESGERVDFCYLGMAYTSYPPDRIRLRHLTDIAVEWAEKVYLDTEALSVNLPACTENEFDTSIDLSPYFTADELENIQVITEMELLPEELR